MVSRVLTFLIYASVALPMALLLAEGAHAENSGGANIGTGAPSATNVTVVSSAKEATGLSVKSGEVIAIDFAKSPVLNIAGECRHHLCL